MHRRALIATASAAALTLPGSRLLAGGKHGRFFAKGGIALGGTDPVAYFREQRPVAGVDDHALKWGGAIWWFSSPENLAAFEADPRAHAPRYGGYCAYAMAEGAIAPTVPEAWTIHNGRLYLNFSLEVREVWRKDMPGYIAKADAHWPAALG